MTITSSSNSYDPYSSNRSLNAGTPTNNNYNGYNNNSTSRNNSMQFAQPPPSPFEEEIVLEVSTPNVPPRYSFIQHETATSTTTVSPYTTSSPTGLPTATATAVSSPYSSSMPPSTTTTTTTSTFSAPPPRPLSSSMPTTASMSNHNPNNDTSSIPRPDIRKLKNRRRAVAASVGVAGGVTGMVIGGPIVALVLGVGGGYAVKARYKHKERQQVKKYHEQVAAASNLSQPLSHEKGEFS